MNEHFISLFIFFLMHDIGSKDHLNIDSIWTISGIINSIGRNIDLLSSQPYFQCLLPPNENNILSQAYIGLNNGTQEIIESSYENFSWNLTKILKLNNLHSTARNWNFHENFRKFYGEQDSCRCHFDADEPYWVTFILNYCNWMT